MLKLNCFTDQGTLEIRLSTIQDVDNIYILADKTSSTISFKLSLLKQ